ncbi:MAG: class I SAM-dependent methyltransferase [Chloroflexota bacterium]
MERHEFLAALHTGLSPRNYLEIGVGTGLSLELSRVPSIGVDPSFNVQTEIRTDIQLVRRTSDRFFARADPLRYLRGGRNPWRNLRHNRPLFGRLRGRGTVDFAFIDGLHLFEFALRDFMNVERHSAATTVIVLDDMLPRNATEAARDRTTQDWTGDVYKLVGVLRQYRPDLITIPVDTQPTGLLVVLAPDHTNTVLRDHYDEIVAANLLPDPQDVPASVLERVDAVAPEALLATRGWRTIVRNRRRPLPASRVRAALRREFTPVLAAARRPSRPGGTAS